MDSTRVSNSFDFFNCFLIPGHKSPIVYLSSLTLFMSILNSILRFWHVFSNIKPAVVAINVVLPDFMAISKKSSYIFTD